MMRPTLVAITLIVLGFASTAVADETRDEVAQREHWQKTFSQAREDLADAKQNLNNADLAYRNMRHRRHARGERKQLIIDAVETAQTELSRAQEGLDAATIAARRAGVPPGWLRENQDAGPASQPSN